MLTLWKAVLLGAIQGATEFLPVSSSGHLVVAQQLLGWAAENETILAFDIALHVGTLASVIVVFWRDVIDMLTGKNWKLVGYLISATIPAVVVAFAFKDWLEGLFSSVVAVGFAWLFTGTFLLLTKWIRISDRQDVGWSRSFLIGCAQALAIIPGISRSGSTIAAGLFLKLDKKMAARFAFLMSIPAIAGGALIEAKELIGFSKELVLPLTGGMIAAAIVGYICIRWLLWLIQRGHLWYFGIYCLLAGAVTLILLI